MSKDLEAMLTACGAVILVFAPAISTAIWFIATH